MKFPTRENHQILRFAAERSNPSPSLAFRHTERHKFHFPMDPSTRGFRGRGGLDRRGCSSKRTCKWRTASSLAQFPPNAEEPKKFRAIQEGNKDSQIKITCSMMHSVSLFKPIPIEFFFFIIKIFSMVWHPDRRSKEPVEEVQGI